MTFEEMAELQGILLCPKCRRHFRRLLRKAEKEEAMADRNGENSDTRVFLFEVRKIGPEAEKDFEVTSAANYGGLELKFRRTIGEIRRFFTERQGRAERRGV